VAETIALGCSAPIGHWNDPFPRSKIAIPHGLVKGLIGVFLQHLRNAAGRQLSRTPGFAK
jgi:hypothetical protein